MNEGFNLQGVIMVNIWFDWGVAIDAIKKTRSIHFLFSCKRCIIAFIQWFPEQWLFDEGYNCCQKVLNALADLHYHAYADFKPKCQYNLKREIKSTSTIVYFIIIKGEKNQLLCIENFNTVGMQKNTMLSIFSTIGSWMLNAMVPFLITNY